MYQLLMGILQQIRAETAEMSAPKLLHYLLKERFPGQTLVTASLKAPSVVVLKMVSDIDPATPVVFCNPKPVYPESESYRKRLVDLLGLTNYSIKIESDSMKNKYSFLYYEKLVNKYEYGGSSTQNIQLNETLKPYCCWIKAVYHERFVEPSGSRVEIYGDKIIVDLLHRRSPEAVDSFMNRHGLPYHPKIHHLKNNNKIKSKSNEDEIGYYF